MPTLTRYLFVVALLAAGLYGIVYALGTYVEPTPRQITIRLPPDRLFR